VDDTKVEHRGGMSFGSAPNQARQRGNARFHSVEVDGHPTGAIRHNKSKQEFRMLPGGRWVEVAVWTREMQRMGKL
jgi:hypothetical protein